MNAQPIASGASQLDPPRTTGVIRAQLADLESLLRSGEAYGERDFAAQLGMASLRTHQRDLIEELRAAELVESQADAELTLDGEPLRDSAIPAQLLGDFLGLAQKLTHSIAQVVVGQPTSRAPVRKEIAAEYRLMVMPGFAPGSFVVRVRLPAPEERGRLFAEGDDVLGTLRDLLDEGVPTEQVAAVLTYSRVKTHYEQLMDLLAKQNVEASIRTRRRPYRATITAREARERLQWLELLQTREETVNQVGQLLGGSLTRGRFELRTDGGTIAGTATEEATAQMRSIRFGQKVVARLRSVTSEHESAVAGPTTEYVAEGFEPAES